MVLEYLTGNEFKKYPFDERSSATSTNGFVLGPNVILDLLFVLTHPINGSSAHIRRFEIDNLDEEVRLTINIYNNLDEIAAPYDFVAVLPFADIEDRNLCSYAGDVEFRLKLIAGPGLKALVDAATDIDEEFEVGALRLASSAVIQSPPRVSSITILTLDTVVITLDSSNTEEVELHITEGSNLSFLDSSGAASLAVIPGAGTGVYNPCGDNEGLQSINGVPPDKNNNFVFDVDGCYVMTKNVSNHGLDFENVCTPKCSKDQLSAFANYLNRVNDGISALATIAANTANELKTTIADYITDVVPVKNQPYIKIGYSKYKGPGTSYYYSVSVGFFNPSNAAITMSLSITHPGTLLPDTCKYLKDDIVTVLELPTSGDGTVDCHSYARTEFVFAGAAADPGNVVVSGTFAGGSVSVTKAIH